MEGERSCNRCEACGSTSRAGGGVEAIIGAGLTLRLEYRYTDLGSYSKSLPLVTTCPGGVCPNSPSYGSIVNLHPTNNAVRVGLGVNF
jgi:outer membrane immunogenic protein